MKASAVILLVTTFAAGHLAARADLGEIVWDDAGQAAQEIEVPPAMFAEWCGKLRAGERVMWRFDANAGINFDIHHLEGKVLRFPAGLTAAEGILEVELDQNYCWMWANKSEATVVLNASVAKVR